MRLDGKVAVVAGASTGIGRAYALALAGVGLTVVAAARTLPDGGDPARHGLEEVGRAGHGLPGAVHACRCDIEEEGDVADLVESTVDTHGRIDVLVNNAGIHPHHEPVDRGGGLGPEHAGQRPGALPRDRTTYLATDLAPHGVAVNALSPGPVLTDTAVAADPVVTAAGRESGHGKDAVPVVHHDEFGKSWP